MKNKYQNRGFTLTSKPGRGPRGGGFTLLELLIAMTVFLVVIGVSAGIFIQALRTQRIITALSEAMNNTTLALEQIAREARTGYNFSNIPEGSLTFTNAHGRTVSYELMDGSIRREVGGVGESITSPDVEVSKLDFELSNREPERITIFTTVVGGRRFDIEVNLQTTVSSRIISP